MPDTQTLIASECDALKEILLSKNAAYGDSALTPLRIFSRADAIEAINVRLDDKISRITRGDGTGDEDAELDLIGYLVLKRVARSRFQPTYVNDVKSNIDEVAAQINAAVNPPIEVKTTEPPIEEVADEWDEERSWKTGTYIRWRGGVWEMTMTPDQSFTYPPGISGCWARVPEGQTLEVSPSARLPKEELDRIEGELKKYSVPVEMINGKPYYRGAEVIHETSLLEEWDSNRLWQPNDLVQWGEFVYRMNSDIPEATFPPDESYYWTKIES